MHLSRTLAILAGSLCALTPAFSQPRSNLFVLPQPGQGGQFSVFDSNPFVSVATPTTIADPAFLFLNPAGTRIYVLGGGSTGTVSVLNAANYAEIARYNLSQQIRSAVMTPDGKKLLVVAGDLRVIDLAFDQPPTVPRIEVGNLPEDVAVSLDSNRAYVVSGASRTITAVDLTTNQRVGQQAITGTPGGVAVGPNGLIYLAASNVIYEIDWQDGFKVTVPGGFTFIGEPGRPVFTPDGKYLVAATRPNDAPSTIVQVEIATRSVVSVTGPANFSNVVVAGNNRAFGVAGGTVYSMNIAPLQPPGISPIGALSGTVAVAVSNEATTAHYLFGQTTNSLYRVDLVNTTFQGPVTTISAANALLFQATPSNGPTTALQRTASAAAVPPGERSFPIAVRAIDATGRPVANVPIQFTTSTGELQLPVTTATTNNDGLASVSAIVPPAAGTYSVRATATGGFVDIPIEVSGSPISDARFSIFRGQGQVVTAGSTAVSFQVRLRNELGEGVPNAVVNWAVESGLGITAVTTTSPTDSQGIATGIFSTELFTPTPTQQFRTFTVQAAVSTGTLDSTISFQGVILPPGYGVNVQLVTSLVPAGGIFNLASGAIVNKAFDALVFTQPPTGSGFVPAAIPNVGIRASVPSEATVDVGCADDPVTSAAGTVSCNLEVGSELGRATMSIVLGELTGQTFLYEINVIPGAPASVIVIQGNGQSGGAGTVTPLAMVIEVRDSAGNPLRNVEIAWSVISGSGELVNPRERTDNNGRASTQLRFGPLPGTVTVRAATGSVSTNFTLTNTAAGGGTLRIDSGSGQSAQINQAFAAPLVVTLTGPGGGPIAGSIVNFTPTGPVTLSSTSATTNGQGVASITATAGSTPGAVTVTAASGGSSSVVFSLNVTPTGPRIDSLVNGASFQQGASPCAIGVVKGSFGIPANTVSTPSVGPVPILAFTLNGISVEFGGRAAPIYYVSNINGEEQVGVQIPCEAPPGMTELKVTLSGAASTTTVNLADVAPGIFETSGANSQLQGVALRPNGTYVTTTNPARFNETITGYFTGLGSTTQAQGTNAPGIGQELPIDRIIVGLNHQGMPTVSASYAPNMIGVWTVKFTVDPVAGEGDRQVYAIGVRNAQGTLVYGQGSALPVRAQ